MTRQYVEPITEAQLIKAREEIHAWPEPGWGEFVSSARAIEKLESLGIRTLCGREVINTDFRAGAVAKQVADALADAKKKGVKAEILDRLDGITGVVGIFDTGRPGPVMAIRAELDCVCVTESTNPEHRPVKGGYASQRPGFMHACGHDGHQAVLMAIAEWVVANKENLCGTLKFVFEPGEEGSRGGRPIAESGILDDVDFFSTIHIGCDIPGGEVVTAPEKFLCSTKVDFRYKGTPSHAGMQPEVGRNALMAASTASLALMAIPRHGQGMTRVNVGYMRAGEGRNVIASTAEMQVEVRGETEAINNYMFNEAVARVKGAAAMYGCEAESEVMGEAIDFIKDDEVQQNFAEAAKQAKYCTKVSDTMNFNGSDDATVLMRRVQNKGGKAGYVVVGSELKAGHHQSKFEFEEIRLQELFDIYHYLAIKHLGAK